MVSSRLLRTKDIDDVIRQNDDPVGGEAHHTRLSKRLSAWDLMGFGIGIVIGTGIFTLTGIQAKNNAGPAIVVSFAIAGVVSLLAALCYAELAAAVPTAGSSYTYAYTTIGEIFAWIIAWDLILEFALGAAVVSRGWSGYLQDALNLPTSVFGEGSTVNVGAIAIALVLGVVAMIGIREAKWVTNALVVVKVSVCVFVIVLGVFFVKLVNLSPFVPPAKAVPPGEALSGLKQPLWQWVSGADPTAYGVTGVFVAAAVVFFAYSGFEAVANLGEETKDPAKDMPRGLLGTLAICTVLYVLVCLVITGMVKYTGLSEGAPISDAFDQVGMGWASILIAIAAIAGAVLGDPGGHRGDGPDRLRAVPRRPAPRWIGQVHPKWQTPYRVTIGTTAVVMLLAGFVPLDALAEMVSIGTLFAFFVVSIAVIVLRRTRPRMKRPFRTPQVPLLPGRVSGAVRGADDQPGPGDVAAVPDLAGDGAGRLLVLRPHPLPARAQQDTVRDATPPPLRREPRRRGGAGGGPRSQARPG